MSYHGAKHFTDFIVLSQQFIMRFFRQVLAVLGKVKPDLRFGCFGVRIRELADKVVRVWKLLDSLKISIASL